jgi:hypothetical protein
MAASRQKRPVTIFNQGCSDSPTSIVQLKSQYRTVRDQASEAPHQFRTRNNLIRTQRTRSKSNKNAAKSRKLIDILPLITVWLQVRVLPGPPAFARVSDEGCRAEAHRAKAGRGRELRLAGQMKSGSY